MKRLIGMMGAGDHCVLISQADEIQTQSGTSLALNTRTTSPTQHALVLCNSIGTPIESKYVDFQPMHWSMNTTHVLVASKSYFYLLGYPFFSTGVTILSFRISGNFPSAIIIYWDQSPMLCSRKLCLFSNVTM